MSTSATSDAVPSKPGYDPAQTRRLLVESSLALFADHGFDATSVQEIVRSAGLTKGAFYHHFEAKEDLLKVIWEEFLDTQELIVGDVVRLYDSPSDQVRELVRALVLGDPAHNVRAAVLFADRRSRSYDGGERLRDRWRRCVANMEAIVGRGIDNGEFASSVRPDVTIFSIVATTAWARRWFGESASFPAEDVAEGLAGTVLEGIRVGRLVVPTERS